MAEGIPNIMLTNPSNKEQAPSPAQSPVKGTGSDRHSNVNAGNGASGRPVTPANSWGRPESSNGSSWTSSIRLKRSPSNNAWSAGNGLQQPEANGGNVAQQEQAAMDPLSQHLLKRTNTPMSPVNSRPRTTDSSPGKDERKSKEPSPAPPVRNLRPTRTDTSRNEAHENAQKEFKKGVKAVSFLSKLMGGAKKKDVESVVAEEASVSGEDRLEGNDATVFAESVDNIAFSPRHPQPPAYIKVRSKNTQKRDFDRLFLAQELRCTKRRKLERQSSKLQRKSSMTPSADNTVWAMEFSKDGKYLAAAGADVIVRVWAVLASSEHRQKYEKQEAGENEANGVNAHAEHLSAPVFQSQPVREFEAHTATILDLSWSKNNFLLSSSMDKTVRLWHMSRPECLCTFKHNDFVPSISFHPKDDRFFLAGSLDSKLRLWSIPDKSVAYVAQVPDMITAVAFTPDGKYAMAGCFSGLVMFFETEGLKYQSQMHVRSSRGQNSKGSKITSIQASYSAGGDIKLLITSNDSRIRLYNFRDKSLELKLKGTENNCSQIRATLSECGKYVTCGSEDKRAYIWSLHSPDGEERDKRPVEFFEAHDSITTIVCLAPTKTREHLSRSEDPVYDLCNPPPVTLMSRAERAESLSSSRPPSVQATPADVDARFEKQQPSPAYLTRSSHNEGNIIVTADFTGTIKVFRQDCAWSKRKVEDWDRSFIFGKRASRSSRAGSLATKASQRSLREGRSSTSTQPAGDRIMTWRQGVATTSALANGARRSESKHTSRSVSPSKSLADRTKIPPERTGSLRSALGEGQQGSSTLQRASTKGSDAAAKSNRSSPNLQMQQYENPLKIQNGQSYVFYDMEHLKERAERLRKIHEANNSSPSYPALTPVQSMDEGEGGLGKAQAGYETNGHLGVRPPLSNGRLSFVSKLSDERSSDEGEAFNDAPEVPRGRDRQCRYCGGMAFVKGRDGEGDVREGCKGCGRFPDR